MGVYFPNGSPNGAPAAATAAVNDDADASDVLDSLELTASGSILWDYFIEQGAGTNARSGIVRATVVLSDDGSSGIAVATTMVDTDVTADVGDSSGFVFEVTNTGTTIKIIAKSTNTANWTVRLQRRVV